MNDKLNELLTTLVSLLQNGAAKLPALAEQIVHEAYMRRVLVSGLFSAILLTAAVLASRGAVYAFKKAKSGNDRKYFDDSYIPVIVGCTMLCALCTMFGLINLHTFAESVGSPIITAIEVLRDVTR